MFRYLALEMCQASLREYVENTIFAKNNAQNKSLLFQTISGLKHLHSLNIGEFLGRSFPFFQGVLAEFYATESCGLPDWFIT